MKVTRPNVQLQNFYGNGIAVKANVSSGQKVVKRNGEKRIVGLRGFAVDVNADGKINGRQDGFLAFPDKNGNYNIEQANRLLTAFSGDFDLNNDGKVTKNERVRGRELRKQARTLDLDKDGVMNNWELVKAGAAVVRKDAFGQAQPVLGIEAYQPPQVPHHQEKFLNQFRLNQAAQAASLRNFTWMFQSMMMASMPGMSFGGAFGGYPQTLAMPIY